MGQDLDLKCVTCGSLFTYRLRDSEPIPTLCGPCWKKDTDRLFAPPTPSEGRIINPTHFAKELIAAVEDDPGTERKAMLFYVNGRKVRFVRFRSEARVMVMELAEDTFTSRLDRKFAEINAAHREERKKL